MIRAHHDQDIGFGGGDPSTEAVEVLSGGQQVLRDRVATHRPPQEGVVGHAQDRNEFCHLRSPRRIPPRS